MTTSHFNKTNLERKELRRIQKSYTAKIVLLGITAIASIIVAGWLAGEGKIKRIFTNVESFF